MDFKLLIIHVIVYIEKVYLVNVFLKYSIILKKEKKMHNYFSYILFSAYSCWKPLPNVQETHR